MLVLPLQSLLELLPPVYSKCGDVLKRLNYDGKQFATVTEEPPTIQDCDCMKEDTLWTHLRNIPSFDGALTDSYISVYCLVVWAKAEDIDAVNRDCLSGVHVYVGKAEGGLRDRWLRNSFKTHCRAVDEVLKAKERYRENKLYHELWAACKSQRIIPADCFLALAYMRGWKNALFIFPCRDNDKDVREWQLKFNATSVCHGLNYKLAGGKSVGK